MNKADITYNAEDLDIKVKLKCLRFTQLRYAGTTKVSVRKVIIVNIGLNQKIV